MSEVTNLRQGVNKIECMGWLAEKDIHASKDSNGKDILEGYVTVKVDDINQIRFNIRTAFLKNDGAQNPSYDNLSKFNLEAKSIAEVGAENCSRVEIKSGQLNPYHSTQSGNDTLGYRTSFISIYRGSEEEWSPKAQADVELFIKGVFPEMSKDGEETGRAILKGVLATYNGVELLNIVIPTEDGMADAALGGDISSGDTMKFFADIKNSRVEKVVSVPTRLGKPRIEKSYDYTNELVMTGCTDPYPEETAYDANAIKLALQEREDRIKKSGDRPKTSSDNGWTSAKPSAAAQGRTANW